MAPSSVLRWGRGHVPSRFTCCPRIQKLVDRSDVISEVPKCSKIQIFQGSAPDPAGGAYSTPPDPQLMGGLTAPSQQPHPCPWPFGPHFYGSQGLTHYRVGNPTNDRFQMLAYMCFFRFRRTEKMDSVTKELMRAMPLQNIWARTAPSCCQQRHCQKDVFCSHSNVSIVRSEEQSTTASHFHMVDTSTAKLHWLIVVQEHGTSKMQHTR